MALINQNSIIGVTSITSPSASNVLTVHTNDTTERLRVSTSGLSFSGTNASLDISGNATFNGNVSIGGTLTYEDVTNIDSVGVITARSDVSIADKIVHTGDTDTAIRFPGADQVSVETGGTQRLLIGSDGKLVHSTSATETVDFGTSNSSGSYHKYDLGASGATVGYIGAGSLIVSGSNVADFGIRSQANLVLASGGDVERVRIDSTGRLLKSGQAALNSTSLSHPIQVASASDANAIAIIGRAADDIGELSFYEADKSTKLGELQYRQDHLNFRHRVGDIRFATGGTTERLRIDSVGKILIGPGAIANPKVTTVGAIDTSNSDWAIVMGGSGSGNRANNAIKDGRFAGAHYTNAEEPIGLVRSYSTSSANEVHIGGGSSLINAATQLSFYTAANTTTTGGTESLRITATGTVESYSTNDTTPNIRWRSNDTNWFGALNQSVEGGTITTFLSCGGDWTANGATYSATKALAAYPTAAFAIHNQYSNSWENAFSFLVKAGGSTTTDGAVHEELRINAKAEIIQTSATTSTNSWYSLGGNNIVKVTNGDNDIYIERVGGSSNYEQLVYKKTPMTDNCDISFRLAGNAPNGTTHRHVGFTICGDGGSDWTDMDRIVFRYRPSNNGLNQIRIDKAGGGTTGSMESSSIPNFFDSNERSILIQVRGRNIHILSDNVLVYSEEMDAALHSVTGYFGISIYEAPANNNPYISIKNFQLTNYGALGVPQKRPCLQTNMSSTYGSYGSLTTNTASTGILQASAYIDLCGNYTTSGSNAYTFVCPVDGIYAVNAHISMGGGSYSRHIWVMSYTLGGGNLPLGTYTEVIDLAPDQHSNHSYYNLWKFTKGTRVGMGINGNSGSLSGRGFQWGIMLVS